MFAAILLSPFGVPGQLLVYGPFATAALAQAWIAAQANPFGYVCAQCWSLPPATPGNPVVGVTIAAGNIVVALVSTNFAGIPAAYLYGTFADVAAAEAWAADQDQPELYTVAVVQVAS